MNKTIVTKDNAYIGMKVVRGRDWKWGNQDYGSKFGTIKESDLQNLLNEICYDEYEHSNKKGYNLHLSDYYDNNDNEGIEYYSVGEFLDLSPIYFEKSNDFNIPDEWLK